MTAHARQRAMHLPAPDCIEGDRPPCPTCPVREDCPWGCRVWQSKKAATVRRARKDK